LIILCTRGRICRWVLASKNKWRLSTLLFLATIAGVNAQGVHFPGSESEAKSPNHQYIIQNLDYEKMEPAHVLVLLDTRSGSKTKIHSYDRHVDILWSPRSDAFVINDYEGSDSARPILYSLPWNGKKTDLLETLTVFLRRRHEESLVLKNDHVYFSVRRWINSHELLCRLEAYGGASPTGSGFKGQYVYRIGEGFRMYSPKAPRN
jgi:hypothetical protein